jgi:serine/threonine-protein kinase ATR
VPQLVIHIQRYALPWLVLSKRKEVVQKIAEYRGEKEAWRPCIDNANLSSILALLLMQDIPVSQIESFSMSLLRHVSPHFNSSSLADLLRAETVQVILELLKAAGDGDQNRRFRVS